MINALCAIAVGIQNNIPAEKILEGISEFELTKNRMETVDGKKGTKIINDSYNANYDSMKAALQYLSNVSSDKKIAILGNMENLEILQKKCIIKLEKKYTITKLIY